MVDLLSWFRRKPRKEPKRIRLVRAVARKELKPIVILLCAKGDGRPTVYPSVMNVPLEVECSCGERHVTGMDDIEISFMQETHGS